MWTPLQERASAVSSLKTKSPAGVGEERSVLGGAGEKVIVLDEQLSSGCSDCDVWATCIESSVDAYRAMGLHSALSDSHIHMWWPWYTY